MTIPQDIREEAERKWKELLDKTAPLLLSDKIDNEAFSWKGGYAAAKMEERQKLQQAVKPSTHVTP
jgi:hypothetical protein